MVKQDNLKPSFYNHYISKFDKKLVFNLCSCSLICLEDNKYSALKNGNLDFFSAKEIETLGKMNFINSIPDEKEFVLKHRYTYKLNDEVLNLTIMTTTACNARCAYCFEKNVEIKSPNDDVVSQIIDFILKSRKKVNINWFGGEPLMNVSIIEKITTALSANNIKYRCGMISNGYLVDKNIENIKKWKIKFVQITLDGINEKYNAVKRYIYKNDNNPFSTVISGIKSLINNKIKVTIRLNFDNLNYKNILQCIDYIKKEIGNSPYLSIYCHHIFGSGRTYYLEDGTNLYYVIICKLIDCGYVNNISQLGLHYKPIPCAAYNPLYFVIDPNGVILKCEHYMLDDKSKCVIGNLKDGIIHQNNFNYRVSRKLPFKKCECCEFLPLCEGGCKFDSTNDTIENVCLPFRDCIDDLIYKYYLSKTE